MLSTEIKVDIEVLFFFGLTRPQVFDEILRNLQSNSEDELSFHLKKVDQSVQEEETLILYLLIIATRNLNVGIVLQCSTNLRKKLMGLCNLTKVLRFHTNFTTKIKTQH